jgi:hypothetical protein
MFARSGSSAQGATYAEDQCTAEHASDSSEPGIVVRCRRRRSASADRAPVQPGGEYLGEMNGCVPGGGLFDLGAAAEAVREHRRVSVGVADGREQDTFGARHGHFVVALFEPEVSGQAAASGVEHVQVDTGVLEQRLIRVVAHDRVLMALCLGDGRAGDVRWLPSVGAVVEQSLS